MDGIGSGAGSAGFVSAGAGVELGVLCESEGALCAKEGSAPKARTRTATKQINRALKVDLLIFDG